MPELCFGKMLGMNYRWMDGGGGGDGRGNAILISHISIIYSIL